MTSIKLKSHVGSDGVLNLQVPVGIKDADLEIMVIVQLSPKPEELGWPPDFFAEVAGGWQGEPLVRAPQGDYEIREELQ